MFKYKNPFEKDLSTPSMDSEPISPTSNMSRATQPYQHLLNDIPPRVLEEKNSYESASLEEIKTPSFIAAAPVKRSFTSPSLQGEAPDTTLGEGVVFKGELTFKRLLRIDGHFEGELLSDGKLVVGPTGVVKAEINMREAIIEGVIEGNIAVHERLELRSHAKVIGNIETRLLSVDEGVIIVGHVSVKPHIEKQG